MHDILIFLVSLFAVSQVTVFSSDISGASRHRRNTTENNQVILRIAKPPHRQIKCVYPEVPCADSRRCYHSIYERCNNQEECIDGSDELGCRAPENEIDDKREPPPRRRKDNFPELFGKLVIGVMVILVLLGVLACVCQFQKYTMRAVSWDSDSLDSVSSFSGQPETQDTTGNTICLTDFSSQKPVEELSTLTTLDPFPPSEVGGAGGGGSFIMQSPQTSTSALECVSWAEIHAPPSGSGAASNTLSPVSAMDQQMGTWTVLQPTVLPSSPPALASPPPRPATSPVVLSSTTDLPTYEEVMTRRRRGDAEL